MKLIKQLPDPFVMQDGQRVTTVEHWHRRREEIKSMMLNMQYGTMPGPPENVTVRSCAAKTLKSGSTQTLLHFEFTPQKQSSQITFGFDQHFLMGLVAPRPLLRTEGKADDWANPEGTCVSFLSTEPIYDFLSVPDRNSIHIREGGHYQGEEDEAALLAFANWHLFGIQPQINFKTLLDDTLEFSACCNWTRHD